MSNPQDRVFYRDLTRSYPVAERAEGIYIWDTDGNRYLDATGGAVVVGIGHGVPEVLEAMSAQARRICFAYGPQFTNRPQQQLAAELAEFSPGDLGYTFFTSGGSEATETAIKLARSYFVERGQPSRHKIISRWRSYHGNTMGALAASGHMLRQRQYKPYLMQVPHIAPPYCYRCFLGKEYPSCQIACAAELERCILEEGPEQVAAFVSEPVSGSSIPGMVPPAEYFPAIREICDRYGVLFIADEVLCGIGRTGRNCAIEHWGVVPDILFCAKGLSSGYAPLGAVIAREGIYETVRRGSGRFEHGFTYSGNPLACATGLAVLRYIRRRGLVARVAEIGEYFLARLKKDLTDLPVVGEIAGKGLLAGVELVMDKDSRVPFPSELQASARVVRACFDRGLIVLGGSGGQADGINGDRLEIAPPYIIERAEIDHVVSTLKDTIAAVGAELLSISHKEAVR